MSSPALQHTNPTSSTLPNLEDELLLRIDPGRIKPLLATWATPTLSYRPNRKLQKVAVDELDKD